MYTILRPRSHTDQHHQRHARRAAVGQLLCVLFERHLALRAAQRRQQSHCRAQLQVWVVYCECSVFRLLCIVSLGNCSDQNGV